MKRAGWPRPALVLGFILGPIIESSLHLATQIHGYSWIGRPVCLAILALIVFTLGWGAWRSGRLRRSRPGAPPRETVSIAVEDGSWRALSIALGAAVAALAVYAAFTSLEWAWDSRFFPLFTAVPLVALAAAVAASDWLALRREGPPAQLPVSWTDAATFGWLLAIVVASYFVTQPLVLALAMGLYLLAACRGRWKMAAAQALIGFLVLEVLFDRLGGVIWQPALLRF